MKAFGDDPTANGNFDLWYDVGDNSWGGTGTPTKLCVSIFSNNRDNFGIPFISVEKMFSLFKNNLMIEFYWVLIADNSHI
jgi:hypothetical protein